VEIATQATPSFVSLAFGNHRAIELTDLSDQCARCVPRPLRLSSEAFEDTTGLGFGGVIWRLKLLIQALIAREGTRRVLVLALLLPFLTQAQLAATHFHLGPDPAERTLFGDLGDKGHSGSHKAPGGDQNCPICQILAASHNFLVGSIAALPRRALVFDELLVASDHSSRVQLVERNWQSRAPPIGLS